MADYPTSFAHYGVLRRSGRYPWGSGGTNLSEAKDFRSAFYALKAQGLTNAAIGDMFDMTSPEIVANVAISGAIVKQDNINTAQKFANQGDGPSAIAKKMGINESSVRGLLAPGASAKRSQLEAIADVIRKRVDNSSGYIDVGKGTEHILQITKSKLDVALAMLKSEGYVTESITQPNATTSHDTRVRVVAKPGETWSSITKNKHLIEGIQAFSNDGGKTFALAQEPLHLDPKRLSVRYGDQGGDKADGVIYIRPNVPDLSMGGASYAQVRIQVGDGHFLKGMAVLKDGLPSGVDVVFNTPKKNTGNVLDVLKPVKASGEPIERFGAIFRQIVDPETGKVSSHLNIVNDDDDWDMWSKTLATQMLSKQKPDFVKRQLDVTYANKKARLDEIMALTNPVVKKELLKIYADEMDSSAIHLKAAALPRQKTHVILPVASLKDNEVYAPGYKDGERLALIRYPHGGKFEIPELINNVRNKEARSIMPPDTARSAIGINSEVAKRLSGADFDGDTVVVIPNDKRRIQSEPPLHKLRNFDPQMEYRGSDPKTGEMLPGVKRMTNTQTEMGKITNLINDMTLLGASHEELTRAVRHSMVVIDAEKHKLDYVRSKKENNINLLIKRYQPGKYAGASTLISRIGRETAIPELKRRPEREGGGTDPKTGEPIWVRSTSNRRVVDENGNETWVKVPKTKPRPAAKDEDGNVTEWEQVPKTMKVATGSRMPGVVIRDPKTGAPRPVNDAYDLVSGPGDQPKTTRGTLVERHYAKYSNDVRELANAARKAYLETPDPRVNLAAKTAYQKEVASLNAKLKVAQANSPRERQAQTLAATIVRIKRESNPAMTKEEIRRAKTNAIRLARDRVGAKPRRITIEPREWEAIQNGAVASNTLREILTKTDTDTVKELAQPKVKLLMQPHNVTLAKSLLNSGYTRAEVAQQLGVSLSTLDRSLT